MAITIAQALEQAGWLSAVSASPRLDVELLLTRVLGRPRSHVHAWPGQTLTAGEQQQFEALLERRSRGEPLAYILGRREFWSLELIVNQHVLVPRPETELLVEQALVHGGEGPRRVLELGTGSGAVALALASERPHWWIMASDSSAGALAVARSNAQHLGLSRLQFVRSDWFDGLSEAPGWDLILSNPPYVDPGDEHLQSAALGFEPRQALVAGNEGLEALQRICRGAGRRLLAGGALLLEHGWRQGASVRGLMRRESALSRVTTVRDLAGHERVSIGTKG